MRSCQAERLAAETVEEREARLQQMRDRLAAESIEEMQMRPQQMSSSQLERLAAENAEEMEVRLNMIERAASARNTWPVASPMHWPGYEARGVPYSLNHLPATPHLE